MHHPFSLGVRVALVFALSLMTCSIRAEIANKHELHKQLQAAETRWKKSGIHSYSYVAARTCKMCDPAVHVTVKNDSCVKALTASEPARELACTGYSMPEIFERLRILINDDISTTSLQITFDDKLGYPSRFQLQTIVPHEKEQDDIVEFKPLK